MVSKNHWTEARIQALCGVRRRSSQNSTRIDIYVDDSSTLPSESSLFLAANQSAPSFTKAVYVKPDLLEVVKRDGVNLTTDQQALLFRMLSNHDAVFKAVKGIIPASQSSYACDPTQFHDEPNHMRFQSKIAKSWKMNLPDNVKLEPFVVTVHWSTKIVNGQVQALESQRRMEPFDSSWIFARLIDGSPDGNSHSQRQKKFSHQSEDLCLLQVSI